MGPLAEQRQMKLKAAIEAARQKQAMLQQLMQSGGGLLRTAVGEMGANQRAQQRGGSPLTKKMQERLYAQGKAGTPGEVTEEHEKDALVVANKKAIAEFQSIMADMESKDENRQKMALDQIKARFPDALEWKGEKGYWGKSPKLGKPVFSSAKLRKALVQEYEAPIKIAQRQRKKQRVATRPRAQKSLEPSTEVVTDKKASRYGGDVYRIGQVIDTPRGKMRVVGFYKDGEPNVKRIR
jgi:hypothetical protein